MFSQSLLTPRLSSIHVVHPDLHSDPVQAHHLQWLCVSQLVSGYRLHHGCVLSGLHTHLCHLQDHKVPRSHLQRGTAHPLQPLKYIEHALWDVSLYCPAYTMAACQQTVNISHWFTYLTTLPSHGPADGRKGFHMYGLVRKHKEVSKVFALKSGTRYWLIIH